MDPPKPAVIVHGPNAKSRRQQRGQIRMNAFWVPQPHLQHQLQPQLSICLTLAATPHSSAAPQSRPQPQPQLQRCNSFQANEPMPRTTSAPASSAAAAAQAAGLGFHQALNFYQPQLHLNATSTASPHLTSTSSTRFKPKCSISPVSLLSYIPFLPGAKRDSSADVGRSDAAGGVNDADDGGGEHGNAHGCTSAGQKKYPNYALNFNCSSISTFVAVHSFQGKSPAPSQISAPAQDAGRNQDANHPLNCNLSCTSTSTSTATSTASITSVRSGGFKGGFRWCFSTCYLFTPP